LTTQKTGGHFVLKMYDIYHRVSFDMVGILKSYYQEIYFYKPKCSPLISSEKYIICKHFTGINDEKLAVLMQLSNRWTAISCKTLPFEWSDTRENSYKLKITDYPIINVPYLDVLKKSRLIIDHTHNDTIGSKSKTSRESIITVSNEVYLHFKDDPHRIRSTFRLQSCDADGSISSIIHTQYDYAALSLLRRYTDNLHRKKYYKFCIAINLYRQAMTMIDSFDGTESSISASDTAVVKNAYKQAISTEHDEISLLEKKIVLAKAWLAVQQETNEEKYSKSLESWKTDCLSIEEKPKQQTQQSQSQSQDQQSQQNPN